MKIFQVIILACIIAFLYSCQQTPEPSKAKPKPTRTLKVACIGDQIMLNEKVDSSERYPSQLQSLLGNDYVVNTFALDDATVLKNGNQPFIKDTLFKQAIDFQPDFVIINLGINDTKMSNWWKYGDEFIGDYMELVTTFQATTSKPEIFICRPTKIFDTTEGINDSTMQVILPHIDSVAAWRFIEKVDLYTISSYRKDLFRGYIYPNNTANRIFAEMLADAILSEIEPL